MITTTFIENILQFPLRNIHKPLEIAKNQSPIPIRVEEKNLGQFYGNYLPFILEEARAGISKGIQQAVKIVELQRDNLPIPHELQDHLPFELLYRTRKTNKPPSQVQTIRFKGNLPEGMLLLSGSTILLIPSASEEQGGVCLAVVCRSNPLEMQTVLSPSKISSFRKYLRKGAKWTACYLGSILSENRMFDSCSKQMMNKTIPPCVRKIATASLSPLNTAPNEYVRREGHSLNIAQQKALNAFFNATDHSTLLLQGPPGTGKTTTLVTLLKCAAVLERKTTLVTAHSNKAVQVLATRAYETFPNVPMILFGSSEKVPKELEEISYIHWYEQVTNNLKTCCHSFVDCCSERTVLPSDVIFTAITLDLNKIKCKLDLFHLVFPPLDKVLETIQLYQVESESVPSSKSIKLNRKLLCSRIATLPEEFSNCLSQETVEHALLTCSKILFMTLITSGRSLFDRLSVDYLLIDEAGQAVEAATIIPLRFNPKKVLLVGDTKQLPATVISEFLNDKLPVKPSNDPTANKNYKWSMMWRLLEENHQPCLMLNEQYRMHAEICQWPSKQFYNNRLITSLILSRTPLSNNGLTSLPYAIYEVKGKAKKDSLTSSISNDNEAKYVARIVNSIRNTSTAANRSIGIITPYAAQKARIAKKLPSTFSLDVNTVDGFQGDEKDIIIISFTRTQMSSFLRDPRRLNVAITRAKYCLIILVSPGLKTTPGLFHKLIQDARMRNCFFCEDQLKRLLN